MVLFRCENGNLVNLEKALYFKTTSGTVEYDGGIPIKGVIVLAIFGYDDGDFGTPLATFKSKKEAQDFIDSLGKIMATENNKVLTVDDVCKKK
ncbi:hypothetical protein [Caldicellulosiruptor morganii]|uniref:Uncharacterized protein n=1 Tax=Caldicellulosiruptor morganii TaxID=1387555 RepID=A0ABY7BKD1_9FIRM|nr:hypothetical protein [Caldicellulosiruptor morganii]WAM33274.1 hypothetical protein OTK00_001767 [Caldicellulosiruptor morganii]